MNRPHGKNNDSTLDDVTNRHVGRRTSCHHTLAGVASGEATTRASFLPHSPTTLMRNATSAAAAVVHRCAGNHATDEGLSHVTMDQPAKDKRKRIDNSVLQTSKRSLTK